MAHHASGSVLILLAAGCVGTACGGAVAEDDSEASSGGGASWTVPQGGVTHRPTSSNGGAIVKNSLYPNGGTKAHSSTYNGASASPGKGGAVSIGSSTGKGGGTAKGGNAGKSSTIKGGSSGRGGTTGIGGKSNPVGGSPQGGSIPQGGSSSQGGSISFGGAFGGNSIVGIAGASWVSVGAPLAGAAGAPAEWLDATIYVARDLTPTDAPCTNGTTRWLAQLSSYLISVRQCTVDEDCTELGLSTACGVICPMPVSRSASASLRQGLYDLAETACPSCPRFTTPDCVNRVSQTLCIGGICRSGG
ncbi:MAG TPA: hypothetical protein VKP30_29990 [Polyangiaceae bacterium]|nr:hypothetical protein [Polyangiaceae bacterium]